MVRGSTFSTFFEYEHQPPFNPAKVGGGGECFSTGSDVFTYDQVGPGVGPSGSCYPFLSDPTDPTSVSSISWTCDATMTTFIDNASPNCNNAIVVSWSASPSPGAPPPPPPPPGPPGPPIFVNSDVTAYASPYDGSECVRAQEANYFRYPFEYMTSQCPYTPPVASSLSPGGITAIVIAVIGSIAIAAFAAICVLQAQRTLDIRKKRAKAAKASSAMTAVRVTSYRG